jgi:two-component system cell cycle sensor histidine kinase/response regulator CckA
MPDHLDPSDKFEQLRQQAEELLHKQVDIAPETPSDIYNLIHELKVHQAELEIQNEELQRAQKELATLHQEFANLYEFAPCGYVTLNNKGIITRANLAAVTLLETDRRSLWHSGFSQFIDLGHENAYISSRKKAGEIRKKQRVELPLKRGKKSPVWVQAYIEADHNDAGEVRQWRIVLMDISPQKAAEAALMQSEERFRDLFEHAPVAYQCLDEHGNVSAVNEAWLETLDYSETDVIGKNFTDFLHPDWKDRFKENFARMKSGGEVLGDEFVMEKRGGTDILVWFIGKISRDVMGIFRQFHCVFYDITAQRRVEKDNKRLEDKLRQAKKMEAIGTLAGGIAHNFNNILMGIQGRVALMSIDKDPSHPDREHLRGIEESVKHAAELTRDLLGFARGGQYEVKPTDLNELIRKGSWMFGRTNKEVAIHENYENDLWPVEVDHGQIQQVLLNLFVNAWQAMPGGGSLFIQTENVALDENYLKPFEINAGKYVRISVVDTGIGMNNATLERIFDPFFSTKETTTSSGLGLASVYGIVKNHGGFINVYSEKGEGATFHIYLPASDKGILAEPPEPDQYGIRYGQDTVLFVDDEIMVIDVAQKMLERLGYRVLIARNGDEALKVYKKQREEIALVILDMIMPGMGGGETYDRMTAIDEDVRVLLSSGYSIKGQAKEIMDRGCKGFIQKPFTLFDLSMKIRAALGEIQSGESGRN